MSHQNLTELTSYIKTFESVVPGKISLPRFTLKSMQAFLEVLHTVFHHDFGEFYIMVQSIHDSVNTLHSADDWVIVYEDPHMTLSCMVGAPRRSEVSLTLSDDTEEKSIPMLTNIVGPVKLVAMKFATTLAENLKNKALVVGDQPGYESICGPGCERNPK